MAWLLLPWLAAADVSQLAAEAVQAAKARERRRRAADPSPYDISQELCWADQSKEERGGPKERSQGD